MLGNGSALFRIQTPQITKHSVNEPIQMDLVKRMVLETCVIILSRLFSFRLHLNDSRDWVLLFEVVVAMLDAPQRYHYF